MNWLEHWDLAFDPFRASISTYIATPSHENVLARLVRAVNSGESKILLDGGPGLGKSTLLRECLKRCRDSQKRIVFASAVLGPIELYSLLAKDLGIRQNKPLNHENAWKSLVDAFELLRRQALGAVIALDNAHLATCRTDLDRLAYLVADTNPCVCLVLAGGGREDLNEEGFPQTRLGPLTRNETLEYVEAKLAAAGRSGPTFTREAISEIHRATLGVPRQINRLCSTCLVAAADQSLVIVKPSLLELVSPASSPSFHLT